MVVAPTSVSAEDIWRETVRGYAEVQVLTEQEVLSEAERNGGDVRIKSKDAEVIISSVEEALGGAELVDQSHLGRRQMTSLRSLSQLLFRRWSEVVGVGQI